MALAVLSGCANADGGSEVQVDPSTSQVIVETQADPWALPLEERPELFDPCAEVPLEAVKQAAGASVSQDARYRQQRPGELLACGWKSDELVFAMLGTWKSYEQYQNDPSGNVQDWEHEVGERTAIQLVDRADDPEMCHNLFFTGAGTVALTASLPTTLKTFRGESFADVCEVLDDVTERVIQFIPEGDFR